MTAIDDLYRAHRNGVDVVDVPELGFVVVEGTGAPDSDTFRDAVQAVYGVTYAAHFAAKQERHAAVPIMPLEAVWWVDRVDLSSSERRARAIWGPGSRDRWHWRAMILQPDPIDADLVRGAIEHVRLRRPSSALDTLEYVRWQEGLCAQILHLGPYAEEPATVARLHQAIADAGYRPRGRHHEIYLSDPRRVDAARLRTILRMPVEAAA